MGKKGGSKKVVGSKKASSQKHDKPVETVVAKKSNKGGKASEKSGKKTDKVEAPVAVVAAPMGAKEAKDFRAGFEDLMRRKFFYVPAFEIYGGVSGLYDYGPPGCAVKANLLSLWKKHFILNEHMLQVDSSALTPEIVLKTSGHVDKFSDFMVRDLENGACHRADKILEDHIDNLLNGGVEEAQKGELLEIRTNAGAYSQEQLGAALRKLGVTAPDTGNGLSDPFPFNLMFGTSIGPTGKVVGYLRPETAQGIFVNFRRLLEYNGGRMPFAAAQIGMAFRNEISPRSGLLRVREFQMAEIEHFVNPNNKRHGSFQQVADLELCLLSRTDQTGADIPRRVRVADAVAQGIIDNETLGYFMARTYLFLVKASVHADKIRFRQHKSTEMAHYAKDCWDAEILTSYGWIECVGIADRAAFDLRQHSGASKVDLSAQEAFETPIVQQLLKVSYNAGVIGKTFKGKGKDLIQLLIDLEADQEAVARFQKGLQEGPVQVGEFEVTPEMAGVALKEEKISVEKYVPSVVEPSFGIGRILYALLEHSYSSTGEGDDVINVLRLAPQMAPVKCAILTLSNKPEFFPRIAERLRRGLVALGMDQKTDNSGAAIGRKYARADEIGVPFAITIDFESEARQLVTVRERDSHEQILVPLKDAAWLIAQLVNGDLTWQEAKGQFQNV